MDSKVSEFLSVEHIVAAGAVVPLSVTAMTKMVLGGGAMAAAPAAGLAGSGLAVLPLGAADFSGLLSVLTVPLGLAVFLVVWLGSHAINVLILLSPWGAIDAGLKAARTALDRAVHGARLEGLGFDLPADLPGIAAARRRCWFCGHIRRVALTVASRFRGLARAAGLLLGLAGVLVLMLGRGAAFDVQSLLPVLAMLGATACYGWSGHMARRWLPGLPPLVTATGSLFSGAVLVAPLALFSLPAQAPSPMVWGAVLALAVGCTSLAYLIYYRLIDRLGATRASTVTYLVPVFGVLWGALFLQEAVSWPMLLGGVLILGGVLLLGWRPRS